jgi:type IV pilus assembly protein PilY1
MWRFDLGSTNPNNWNIRFGTGTNPMFVATNPSSQPQPITAAPLVALNANGTKTFVFFGTGRYLGISDKANQDIQSWYGLIDEGTSTITRAELVRRRLTISGTATLPSGKATTVRSVESRTDEHDMNNKRGWYINFDVQGDEGERVIHSAFLVRAGRGTVVEVPSIIPVGSDPCQAGGRGYINYVDAFSGAAVNFPFIDLNGDGIVDDRDVLPNNHSDGKPDYGNSIDLQSAMPGNIGMVGDQNVIGGTSGKVTNLGKNLGGDTPSNRGRISWREIFE